MALNSIEELIEDIRAGKMVILMDDEDRENEGDLIIASECVTAEHINFMARFARGLICMPMSRERMYAVAVRKDLAKHLPRRVSHRKGLAQNALDAVGYKGIGGYLSAPSVAKPSWLNDFIDRDFDPALLMTATQRAECLKKLDSGDQVIPERWMFFPNDNHGAVVDTRRSSLPPASPTPCLSTVVASARAAAASVPTAPSP